MAGVAAGSVIMAFVVWRQWRAEYGTVQSLLAISGEISDSPVPSFAEGIFSTMVALVLILIGMFAGAMLATYLARTPIAGFSLAAVAFVARGIVGMSVAALMTKVDPMYMEAYRDIPGTLEVWMAAAGTVIPAALAGTYIGARISDRSRAWAYSDSREGELSEQTAWLEPDRGLAPDFVPYEPTAYAPEPTVVDVAPTPRVVKTPPSPAERISVTCTKCGASNVLHRSQCIRCGTALQTT